MKTYIFTYFNKDYECLTFKVKANRFTQAFDVFCMHIPSIPDISGFSPSYKVISETTSCYRFLTYSRILRLESIKDQVQ